MDSLEQLVEEVPPEARTSAYGQADLRQPEFGSAEWFAGVQEWPF